MLDGEPVLSHRKKMSHHDELPINVAPQKCGDTFFACSKFTKQYAVCMENHGFPGKWSTNDWFSMCTICRGVHQVTQPFLTSHWYRNIRNTDFTSWRFTVDWISWNMSTQIPRSSYVLGLQTTDPAFVWHQPPRCSALVHRQSPPNLGPFFLRLAPGICGSHLASSKGLLGSSLEEA